MPELTATKNLREEFEQLLPFCSVSNPMIISRQTLRTALQRFLADEIDPTDFVAWANLIELHDEVQYERGFEKLIADVVFCIASPEINGPLNSDTCQGFLSQLATPP